MPARSRGSYDLVLDAGDIIVGLNLARKPGRSGGPGPAPAVSVRMGSGRADEQAQIADVPRVFGELVRGMGYTRRVAGVDDGYSHCLPGYTRSPGALLCPAGKLTEVALPASGWDMDNIVESHPFMGNIYLINAGQHILEMPGGDGPARVAAAGGAGFRGHGAALFNNRLYVGGAFGGLMYKDGSSGAWSAVATSVTRKWPRSVNWRPLGVPTDVLVAVDPNVGTPPADAARWCPITADPMDPTSWSAPVPIGTDRRYFVSQVVAAPRHCYFLRSDGCYDIDELGTRAFNLAPWIAETADRNNGAWGIHTGDGLYYGHSQGLAFIPTEGEVQHDPEWVHPGTGLPYEGPVRGDAMAGTLHAGWRLVAFNDYFGGTRSSYICAGQPDRARATGSTHVWHGAEAILPGRITHMRVHPTGTIGGWPRLLIATTDDAQVETPPRTPTIKVFWQSLPKVGTPVSEMLLGGGFEPADAASLFLPIDSWDRPSAVKSLLQFDLITERLTTANVVRIYAGADDGPAYVEQGAADGASSTPTGTAYTQLRPVELTEGRFLRTRIDLSGQPILRSFEERAAVGIDLRESRSYTVVLGWDNALKTPRAREVRDPEARLAQLREMLGRVVMLDDGKLARARVQQVLPLERVAVGGGARAGAWAMTAEVTLTILDDPFNYDGVGRWDTDRTWG